MIDSLNQVHPKAFVGSGVKIGVGNIIGANCIIDGNISIGDNNIIKENVIISNNVEIGNDNIIYPFVCIGQEGEMGREREKIFDNGEVQIGNRNVFRERVIIHSPFYKLKTSIGDACYLMNNSYVAHDVCLNNNVSLSAGVKLGGRVVIKDGANLGMGCTVHQRVVIGEYVMLGMNAAVVEHIPPFALATGVPARIMKFNRHAANKLAYAIEDLDAIENNYKIIVENSFDFQHEIVEKIIVFAKENQNKLCSFHG